MKGRTVFVAWTNDTAVADGLPIIGELNSPGSGSWITSGQLNNPRTATGKSISAVGRLQFSPGFLYLVLPVERLGEFTFSYPPASALRRIARKCPVDVTFHIDDNRDTSRWANPYPKSYVDISPRGGGSARRDSLLDRAARWFTAALGRDNYVYITHRDGRAWTVFGAVSPNPLTADGVSKPPSGLSLRDPNAALYEASK